MKNHRPDTAIVFPDPQDKILSGKARGWPLAIRKITRFLYTFLNFGLAMFALNANSFAASAAKKSSPVTKPTIVLVHGAFAESSSWNGVVKRLLAERIFISNRTNSPSSSPPTSRSPRQN